MGDFIIAAIIAVALYYVFKPRKRKEPPQEYIDPVLEMTRAAIMVGDRKKIVAIFAYLLPGPAKLIMDRLDHVERQVVISALTEAP